MLNKPISEDIVNMALKSLPVDKASEPDGFTLFYYKTFRQTSAPKFVSAFNSILQGNPILKDTVHAHITALKPDKDLFGNKISFLFGGGIIHADQSGFLPAREARDNTTRALNIIHLCNSIALPEMLLPTDAGEAVIG